MKKEFCEKILTKCCDAEITCGGWETPLEGNCRPFYVCSKCRKKLHKPDIYIIEIKTEKFNLLKLLYAKWKRAK